MRTLTAALLAVSLSCASQSPSTPKVEAPKTETPKAEELKDAARKHGTTNASRAASHILKAKGCTSCHAGLGESVPGDVPIVVRDGGCMGGKSGPRFAFNLVTRQAIAAYLEVAAEEKHPSPFAARRVRLQQADCVRCHQRDTDRPSPLEEVGTSFGGSQLQTVPFLRTPRLTYPHQKFERNHLTSAVREGVSGLRFDRFTYRMPAFGHEAESLVQALAEADGELPMETAARPAAISLNVGAPATFIVELAAAQFPSLRSIAVTTGFEAQRLVALPPRQTTTVNTDLAISAKTADGRLTLPWRGDRDTAAVVNHVTVRGRYVSYLRVGDCTRAGQHQ